MPNHTHAFVGYDADGIPVEIMVDDGTRDTDHAAAEVLRAGGRVERMTIEAARKVRLYEQPAAASIPPGQPTYGVDVQRDVIIAAPPAATCEHLFCDADGNRVYLYCQRGCGTRDPEEPLPRHERQAKIFAWAQAAFTVEQATSLPQRGIRMLEEALEAFQSVGGDPAQAHELVDFVFGRPVGELGQELGGVSVCLLALAAAAGLSADDEEQREVARVLAKPIEEFTRRNAAKNAAGFLAQPAAASAPAAAALTHDVELDRLIAEARRGPDDSLHPDTDRGRLSAVLRLAADALEAERAEVRRLQAVILTSSGCFTAEQVKHILAIDGTPASRRAPAQATAPEPVGRRVVRPRRRSRR